MVKVSSIARRTTRQRQVILDIVTAAKSHPTAEQVHLEARQALPHISLATVYRNLHLLVAEGRIREVQFRDSTLRYDGMLEPHEHFYCRSCGSIVDLPASLPVSAVSQVEQTLQSRVEQYTLDYYGVCSSCSSEASTKLTAKP